MPDRRRNTLPRLWPALGLGVLLCVALGGCGVVVADMEEVLDYARNLRADPPEVLLLDRAYAALQSGRHADAETYLDATLTNDPANPYALLNLGVVYERTGRAAQARDIYRDLARRGVDAPIERATEPALVGKTVADLARHNLARMEAGGRVPRDTGQPIVPYRLRSDSGAAGRFTTLDRLRAAGLVSAEEYAARRQANLGALLPASQPRPSAELNGPAAPAPEIMARLHALAATAQANRMSPTEAAAERARILDSLLPETPATNPPAPPADTVEAIAALDRHRADGLVSPEEFAQERRALGAPVTATTLPPLTPTSPETKADSAPEPVAGAPAPPTALGEHALGRINPAAGPRGVGPPTPLQPRRGPSAL